MQNLIGEKVLAIYVDHEDQAELVFQTEKGYLAYRLDADCCSESWFADIVGVTALLGQTVNDAEDVELNDVMLQDDRCRQEVDRFYGTKLTTAKGYVDIVFRNSSNGYYGGDINNGNWYEEGRFKVDNFEKIEDDWSA
jgi:hypothetical protein